MTDEHDVAAMRAFIDERADGALVWNNCDEAIIGVVERCGGPPLVCYDYTLLVECFLDDETDWDAAQEWVDYNIVGAYIDERTPMILYRPEA